MVLLKGLPACIFLLFNVIDSSRPPLVTIFAWGVVSKCKSYINVFFCFVLFHSQKKNHAKTPQLNQRSHQELFKQRKAKCLHIARQ